MKTGKWVIDPPQGWLYGFPKQKSEETDTYGITYRMWPADD